MEQFYTSKKEKTSFQDIVLMHLKKILDITALEFRGGYNDTKQVGAFLEKIYVPNTRKQYCQTVESLSDVLLPFFDKEMKDDCKKINESVDKKYKEIMDNEKSKDSLMERDHQFFIEKLKLMRDLFQKINLLMNRINYLKASVYGEEDIVDID